MKLELLKNDRKKESEGVKVFLDDTTWLLVARIDNPRYREAAMKLSLQQRRAIQSGRLSAEKQQEIMADIYADAILLGWDGLTENGAPVEYSKANAKRLLMEYRGIWDAVDQASRDDALFAAEWEQDSGNSSKKKSTGS